MRYSLLLPLVFAALLLSVPPLRAQLELPPDEPIRIGRTPGLSPDGSRICFSWQGNLWTAPVKGGPATRLTANDSTDMNPRWSPDGKWIAFNSDREGGNQVFLIPAVGGPARQVTFHSAPTVVWDWFPDGKALAVTSSRDTRSSTIYRLELPSGKFKPLVRDEVKCLYPSVSPDGKWVAYTRGALVDVIRKGYRGSANYDIYVAPADGSGSPRRLTDSDRNDMWPAWSGDSKTVYFSSERGGLATVWKQALDGKPERMVQAPPDAVRYLAASRNGKTLAFEADNWICTAPAQGSTCERVPLLCRTDERGSQTTYASMNGTGASEFALSRDGKKVAFVVRGDIFTITVDRAGDAKRLTDNPTRDQDVAWAPDGKALAYSSNRDGGYRLYRVDVTTKETAQLTRGSSTDTDPQYSPDGKWIAFRRGPQTSLWVIKPDGSGEQQAVKGPKIAEFYWSPDGKWLLFQREDDIRTDDIWLASVTAEGDALKFGEPINVTDHPGFNQTPRWFPDGTRVAFISNRYRNRDVETINHQGKYSLYTTPLEREKEKFEEDEDAPKPAAPAAMPKPVEVKVDAREIERRAKSIVSMERSVEWVAVAPDSKLIGFTVDGDGGTEVWQCTADGSSQQKLATAPGSAAYLQWSPDGSRLYYLSGGAIRWAGKGGQGSGTLPFTVRMEINRKVDYQAVFDEAWQIINDTYYDKSFHGVDWRAMGDKYRALIPYVSTRADVTYVVTQMLGELNSSHTGFGTAGGTARPVRQSAYLGIWPDADYTGNGIRIKEVLARGPADREESLLKAGEYLLAVDGQDVLNDASYDRALLDKVGRTVTLLVNGTPSKEGARTVKIKPISRTAWSSLMYERWVDGRRADVERVSQGRLGYLHVDDMGDTARNRFERELFSIGMRKEGMVIDLRDNSGGDTHDSLLRILARNKHYFTFAPRRETPFPQPERAYTRPIILLINEGSLSDAECFSNGFRELGLGKIVGVPTMGWIIFTSGQVLVDGSFIRTPHLGCFTLSGRDMENWGVPPDIRVENSAADAAGGKDPQLERAVAELLGDPRIKK